MIKYLRASLLKFVKLATSGSENWEVLETTYLLKTFFESDLSFQALLSANGSLSSVSNVLSISI